MKNSIIIFLILGVIMACNANEAEQHKLVEKNKPDYPKIIDSLGLVKLYNDVKWNLYLINCIDTPANSEGKYITTPPRTYASLDLRFDSLNISGDTLKFYFDYYDGSTNLSSYRLSVGFYKGMMFYPGMDTLKKCWLSDYSYMNPHCVTLNDPSAYSTVEEKLINPLQRNVVEFINIHKSILNPWFYTEAKKRGVIKE